MSLRDAHGHVELREKYPTDDTAQKVMMRWTLSNALAVFVICCSSPAIAQTTTNQPPASSAQGATPSNAPAQSLEQEINSEVAEAGNGKASLTEVNKELSNPISTIWALSFQQNTFWLNKPERNMVNVLFQPVLPISLTSNWNLISRPVIPVFNSTPYVNKSGNLHRVTDSAIPHWWNCFRRVRG